MSLAAKLLLSPLLVAQALGTRARLPRLPEAAGERTGVVGRGPRLDLLILGDSSAAGVGVAHQRDAFAGQLTRCLAARGGLQVHWRLIARTGVNSEQCFGLLDDAGDELRADIAVLVLGVNDVVDQLPSVRAVAARERLANRLRNRHGVAHVVFAPLPPVHQFPGLPQPLRWVAGSDARRHDRAAARWAATRGDVSHVPIDITLGPGTMASDGFHPGEPVYRACGEAIAAHITSRWRSTPMSLKGKTLFITGASRGIGLAIARRAARDGAHIVIAAKTDEPNPKLPGTIHSAAAEVEAAGGQALPLVTDIRDEASVLAAVEAAVKRFGGIDILVNNASAISLTPTPATPMKRFDLMFGVNVRGTYLCTQACLPHLAASAKAGRGAHVLNMAPPLSMKPHWFKGHTAYTMAKYGMSMCTLGHAAEFKALGVAVNSLWPRTAIATAALQMIPGVDTGKCRTPEILSDAAYLVLTSDPKTTTGNFFIDDTLLGQHGVTDLEKYSVTPGTKDFIPDFFVD